MKKNLLASGLIIAPEKVQRSEPYSYLGFQLFAQYFTPQKIELRKDHLKSLNDFQKLLGDINCLRPSLGLTTGDLKPLFEILKGDSDREGGDLLNVFAQVISLVLPTTARIALPSIYFH